jgi:hypothetical protein
MMDSAAIDAALVLKLQSDTALAALMPAGAFVYMDLALAGSTTFVRVALDSPHDEPMFGGRAYEDAVFLVEAVELHREDVTAHVREAAARIDAVLDPQPPLPPATITIAGYGLLVLRRVGRVRLTERHSTDAALRWSHRGGRYQLMAAPRAAA